MAKKLLRAVLRCFVALLPFLLLMVRELPAGRESGNMESYFLSVFGGPASAGGDIALLFLELVPSVLIFYLFSGVMLEDCAINYVYVFPRMGKMGPWLRQKVLWLLAQILFTFLLAFAVGFAFGFGAGFRVKQGWILYARLLLFQCGVLFVMSFIQNFLSLGQGRTKSFVITLIFYIASIEAGALLPKAGPAAGLIATLLPPVSQVYALHSDCPLSAGADVAYAAPIPGFTTLRTAIVLSVLFLLCYGVALTVLKKKDLSELMKGESL